MLIFGSFSSKKPEKFSAVFKKKKKKKKKKDQHRMFSEGSSATEDWSNGALPKAGTSIMEVA